MVGRGNAGWTTSKSVHICPCQNCLQGPPAEKTGRGSLQNRFSCPPDDLIGQGTELKLILDKLIDAGFIYLCTKQIIATALSEAFQIISCSDDLFLGCKDFGRMFDHSFPACAFFFFKVKISLHTLIQSLMPGAVHSGLVS